MADTRMAVATPTPESILDGGERSDGGIAEAAEAFAEELREEEDGEPRRSRKKRDTPDPARQPDEGATPEDEDEDEADPLEDPVLEGKPKSDEDEDAEDEDEDDEAKDEDEGEDPEFDVTVAGKVEKVPLSELVNGYSREADYRQKTQLVAQERQQVHDYAQQVETRGQTLEEALSLYQDLIRAVMPSQQNWDALRVSDPQQYIASQEQWGKFLQHVDKAEEERTRLKTESSQLSERQRLQTIQAENEKLLNVLPQLRDPVKAKQFSDSIFELGKKMGFDAREIAATLTDHRFVLMGYFASQYVRIKQVQTGNRKMLKAPKPQASSAQSRVPMSSKTRAQLSNQRSRQNADRQLAKTGSIQDAASAFTEMLRS